MLNRLAIRAALPAFVVAVAVSLTAPASAQEVLSPRLMIALDTSGSMVRTLGGGFSPWTFGDGSLQNCTFTAAGGGHWCGVDCTAGVDQGDADNLPNESRIFIAKESIRSMLLAYGYVDWGFARFDQNTGSRINCWGSYHDQWCATNLGEPAPCINYAGTCTGGDVLVGFPDMGAFTGMSNTYAILSWIDHQETAFNPSTTVGNFCNTASGTTDCEVRANGSTPLAGLITSAGGYMSPIRAADPRSCRNYAVILIADGGESCGGNPPNAAAALNSGPNPIQTYVVGLGTDATLRAALNAIATSGGTDAGAPGGDTAFFVTNQAELSAGLSEIVANSLVFETCNGADDDCDGLIDEGVTNACGGCGAPPAEICNGMDEDCDMAVDEGVTNACGTCGPPPAEVCNRSDDDCDGIIDEDGMGGDICGMCAPTAEACDGLDNDCDTIIDEGVTRPCGLSIGACSPGTETCIVGGSGMFGACVGSTGPTTETCNNIDDDCDGSIDGFSRPCDTTGHMGRGICQPGMQLCTAGSFGMCIGEITPRTEVCNNADDDCDGSVDEMNPGGGGSCGSSIPPCTPGTFTCMGGTLVCTGGVSGSPETCNNADDDCDAVVDEGNPGGGMQCGPMTDMGQCNFGVQTCVMGGIQCLGATFPTMEVCDTADNDCDGSTDEGNPGGGAACGSATPPCMQGVLTCNPMTGGLDCVGEVAGSAETCDAMDNDCDTRIDEGIPVGAPCGSSIGECRPGVNVCNPMTGGFDCQGGIGPESEVCDSLDNDCDMMIDEGLGLGGPCGSGEGLCMPGIERCVSGRLICEGEIGPARETCDCDDNDCDGATDEMPMTGALCPPGSTCFDCQCALPCTVSEFGFECPTGKTPREENGMCFCVADRCDETACATETREQDGETRCTPDSPDVANCVCRNNECTFSCDGVVCMGGTVCNPRDPLGRCVANDCNGLGCDAGEICNITSGECEADPCATVTCMSNEACRGGTCEPTCASVMCADGELCSAGVCVADQCAGVSCTGGQVCDPASGDCVDDLCATVNCPAGQVCEVASGNCVADPCSALTCPSGTMCEAGECVMEVQPEDDAGPPDFDAGTGDDRDRVLASGGCNCRVGPSPAAPSPGPWALVIGLFGLVAWRRRKGGLPAPFGRALLRAGLVGMGLAAVLFFAAGCDVDPFCLDCVDGEEDGGLGEGGVDAGRGDAGAGDAGLPDGATDGATDAATEEVCNEVDDDGDGRIDEDFDTQTDTEHCGGCGQLCAPLGAFAACNGGVCEIDRCDVGRFDLNNDPSDGCEYRCLVEEPDDTICDLRDNDCDGNVDEDVDLQADPTNCGSCAFTCQFNNAAATCVMGSCTLGACDTDWYNIDSDPTNGCEYNCTPGTPGAELCDLDDNDCDGTIDEGNPGGGGACGETRGVCTAGTETCTGGTLECVGGVRPGTEVCGPAGAPTDEDCDGNVDEGHPPRACGTSTGICRQGNEQCMAGSVVCVGETPPAPAEDCNGLDDDCDMAVDEGNPGGGMACGSAVGECTQGMLTCTSPSLTCSGGTGPALDVCDTLDNDCDMAVDEGFDLQNDASNCGMCGRTCSFPNGVAACTMGACQLVGCLPGFVNDDGNDANGCEYACNFTGAEICDGVDNDCDTSTVESALTPPPNFCNPNGVCAGTTPTCMGASGWVCSYTNPLYEVTETLCDAVDNDCDGAVNEPFPTLGNACGNGAGACRTTGTIVCNAAMTGTECSAAPPLPPAPNELCNNIDDDCDNLIDENIPLSAIPTVQYAGVSGTVRMMAYEASRPDATAADAGSVGARACSAANVMPWTSVSWTEARDACCALNAGGACSGTGWRLCDAPDWEIACEASAGNCTWSYMSMCMASSVNTCNGEEYDSDGATAGDQDALFSTANATFGTCLADWGGAGVIYDLSGNAREWTNTQTISANVHQIRGGSYNNVEPGRTCQFDFTAGDNNFAVPNTGFRCCFY